MQPFPDWAEFFSPEFDPASLGELTETSLERYAAASKAYVDSFTVPVGLTPKEVVWSLNKTEL